VGGTGECSRVVRTKPGQRTGETLYYTEDGRVWTDEVPLGCSQFTGGTGQVIGYQHGDRICTHR
jgi:hypothetical protein